MTDSATACSEHVLLVNKGGTMWLKVIDVKKGYWAEAPLPSKLKDLIIGAYEHNFEVERDYAWNHIQDGGIVRDHMQDPEASYWINEASKIPIMKEQSE